MPAIADSRFLIIATPGFEESELIEPRDRLKAMRSKSATATPAFLPGGQMNSDTLRINDNALAVSKVAICHGHPPSVMAAHRNVPGQRARCGVGHFHTNRGRQCRGPLWSVGIVISRHRGDPEPFIAKIG